MYFILQKGLPDSAYDLLVEEYSKNIPDDEKKWSHIYGLVTGDAMFVNPMIETAKQHFSKLNKLSVMQLKLQQIQLMKLKNSFKHYAQRRITIVVDVAFATDPYFLLL